jgi:sugar lactone lactonase YvrE
MPADLGDLVVDGHGRAYVGSQAREGGTIMRLDPDDSVTLVAEDLDFPNGMVVTPDGSTLIVAESTARRLSAYDIGTGGDLSGRRVFAEGLDGPPDGIALDAEGAVWTSMTLARQFERVLAGGAVTDRVEIGERAAIACMFGGPDRRTLFLLSSSDAYPARLVGARAARVETIRVDLLGGVPADGDLWVSATVERGGRQIELVSAVMFGQGPDGSPRPVARASGWRFQTLDTVALVLSSVPPLPPREQGHNRNLCRASR